MHFDAFEMTTKGMIFTGAPTLTSHINQCDEIQQCNEMQIKKRTSSEIYIDIVRRRNDCLDDLLLETKGG